MRKLLLILVLAVMCSSVARAGDSEDAEKASQRISYVQHLAEQGDDDAQYNLGLMYIRGEGIAQDFKESAKWFRLAAEQGNANAQWYLGNMQRDGDGVIQDYKEAVSWFRKAAEQGHADAQWSLGSMYLDGRGVTQDPGESVKWYRLAAEQGNADAQWSLGTLYLIGIGVIKDLKKSVDWFRLAAEQGQKMAQNNLAQMYMRGEGVTIDYEEGEKWFLLAAEQGYVDAQYALGVIYKNGFTRDPDSKEAEKWYRLAAEQGDARSQYDLGQMYSEGQGVIRDLVLAHIWYNLAASNGSERGKKKRDFIALEMDSTQISKAQDIARDCLIKKYKNCDFSSAVYSEEPKVDAINEEKIALACSGKHPQRNIQNTVLFLIDRKKDVLQESRYCGSFEDVDIVLGSVKDNQLVWYSASPFVRNAYGEKILNLNKLKFEYRRTWRRSHEKGGAVRGERAWSAPCNIIDWEDAIELRKELRC